MKYYQNAKTFRNNWYVHPVLGTNRIKMLKNEAGQSERVFIAPLEIRERSGLFAPQTQVDFLPYIKTRSMKTGNYATTAQLVQRAILAVQIYTKKKNPYLAFEQGLRNSLPILGVKLISKTMSSKKYDVGLLKEMPVTSLISKWLVKAMQTTDRNIANRASCAMASEVFSLLNNHGASILLKKRNQFYADLWNLYNLKDEETS